MSFVYFNANPTHSYNVDDCTINAICAIFNIKWEEAYIRLCDYGLSLHLMPSSKVVWNKFWEDQGFKKKVLPDACPVCYSVRDFCRDYFVGEYILALDSHVLAIINGDYYDSVDSGEAVPIFYWKRRV